MIKEKDLREMRPNVRYQNGEAITLQTLQNALQDAANAHGIAVAFYADEVKYGGFIGGGTEPCLVLYHPEHEKDYFKVCIRVKKQGNYAFVSVNDFGVSTQLGNAGSKEFLKDTMKNGSGAEKVGALVGAGLRMMFKGGANKQKLEEEQMWYAIVEDMFDEIVC